MTNKSDDRFYKAVKQFNRRIHEYFGENHGLKPDARVCHYCTHFVGAGNLVTPCYCEIHKRRTSEDETCEEFNYMFKED